ncbi:uncharacterized protein LOC134189135 [Corticium candelabrum]|uniref:uncharacterized protein LOC134189135 n=1 Tax=Corticium candelabrum TaxID=121492 RepID=UPI002E25A4B4|nr:uncharacterized protein LOC134189135 [Corticium candelabrum]
MSMAVDKLPFMFLYQVCRFSIVCSTMNNYSIISYVDIAPTVSSFSSSPLSFSSSVSSTSPLLATTSTSHVTTSQGALQETTLPTASTSHASTSQGSASTRHASTSQGSASQETTLPTASTSHASTSQGPSHETSTNATPPISTSVTSQTDSTSSIFVAATKSTSNLLCNCESSNGWKIAAALGWTFSAILLCVCITHMWFHYGKNKHKATIPQLNRTSRENDETVVTRNPAYSAVAMWQDRSMETTAHYEDVN